jgi:poly(hydroxyalkanoate) granule-associated protein
MQETTLVNLNDYPSVNQAIDFLHKASLAGLGACARVQRQSTTLFESLVAKGEEVQAGLKKNVTGQVNAAEKQFEGVVKDAKGTWNKLGSTFQDYVSRMLKQLGVPSRDDVEKLSKLVEKLDHSVLELAEVRKFNGQATV